MIYSSCYALLERGRFPSWAEEERAHDLAWMEENWPASRVGYKKRGLGALVVDITTVLVHEAGLAAPLPFWHPCAVQLLAYSAPFFVRGSA